MGQTEKKRSRRQLRHEARTALNQILGYSEMLIEQCEEQQSETAADLKAIHAAGKRLVACVDMLAPADEDNRSTPQPTNVGADLPQETPSEESIATDSTLPGPTGTARLLVVDDNEANRDVLTRRLRKNGYEVVSAPNGPEAIKAVDRIRFDLILLDVMMPEMNGLEVLAHLRQSQGPASLPVIMATAKDSSDDVVEALKCGANDYVTKPLDMPVVLARVDAQIALKNARDEISKLNSSLEQAQEKLAALAESSGQALQDLRSWTEATAKEIAQAIGSKEIAVWVFEDRKLVGITGESIETPSELNLQRLANAGRRIDRGDDMLLPVLGLSGELFGALGVPSAGKSPSRAGARLLKSFARQLGGALELKRAREELSQVAARQRQEREELLRQGVDVLHICPECGACFDQDQDTCDEDGTPLEAPPAFPLSVVGRYRLVRVLGEGGMGTVFEAQDERLDRKVAIKVVKSDNFRDDTTRLRFEHEARAVARIDHPGVVSVYDSGELHDGSLYIVMELLRGRDVGSVTKSFGPGSPSQVAQLLRQGAAALRAAHQAGIVHRDIKPANIFLAGSPDAFRVKIVDFGVAKELTRETRLTQTGMLVGTPLFMSPEQILCQPTDVRSDVYSFAAVAFLALSGRRVTMEEEFVEVLLDVVHTKPPVLSSLVPEATKKMDEAFRLALAKKPDKRPSCPVEWVDSFVDDLEQMASAEAGWVDLSPQKPGGPPSLLIGSVHDATSATLRPRNKKTE